jgi:predicted nucleic acid-binding protein
MDTSVFGGYYDPEFAKGTKRFFESLFAGRGSAIVSDMLVAELVGAPSRVQDLLERVLEGECERVGFSEEAGRLRDAYLAGGVLTSRWSDDALHVALATVAAADVIVSWNFRHLVSPLRIRGFNRINAAQGYGGVVIMTPQDVAETWKEAEDEP